MCISFEMSIIAWSIGTICGVLLLPQSISVGIWTIYYSLIQLLEALAYKGFKFPKLTHMLLTSQVFVGLASVICLDGQHDVITYVLCFAAFVLFILEFGGSIYISCNKKDKGACTNLPCNERCIWKFESTDYVMYGYTVLFIWAIIFRPKFAVLHSAILALVVFFQGLMKPSFWCFSAAVSAPIHFLIV